MERKGKSLTLGVFSRNKQQGEKIAVLTAYDLTSALIASAGGVDAILVGDSLGMVVLGHENTLPVTLDDVLHHCKAVSRARPQVPIIADMPYGSFHVSVEETVRNALRLIKEGGANAVKVEGGRSRGAVIGALIEAEIPVMGHLGLTPQSINQLGGYRVQGRDTETAQRLEDEAQFLSDAGCFAIVLECMPTSLSERISRAMAIPTIGIGAGNGCDGQVLVIHDMLGLFTGLKPKFVKRYAHLGDDAVVAVTKYVQEVREGVFPGKDHSYADQTGTGRGRVVNTGPDSEGVVTEQAPKSGYLSDVANGKE